MAALAKGTIAVPNGEFPLTWEDFHRIASLVHGESGIVLTEGKVNLVYSRLAKRLRAIGLRNFRDYCGLVHSPDGADERQAMICALTTNVTRFFREDHHFKYLHDVLCPQFRRTLDAGGRVRIWSAACSSGEEPYSAALTILRAIPDAAQRDILILATDLDGDILARGEAGVYPAERLMDIPVEYRGGVERSSHDSGFSFSPAIRTMIRFKELNLLSDWPIRNKFDLIFCRNVMIYFDDETQSRIWARFAQQMTPDASLCIGHSERVGNEHPFELVGQTIYRRRSA